MNANSRNAPFTMSDSTVEATDIKYVAIRFQLFLRRVVNAKLGAGLTRTKIKMVYVPS